MADSKKVEATVEKASKKAKAAKAPKASSNKKYAPVTAHDYDVIIKPIVTEKSIRLMQQENKFTIKVAEGSNSTEIKQAFESIFNKKVERVNIVNVRRKGKRLGRYEGYVGGYKKAIIKLAPGETLDLFQDDKK